MMEREPIEKTLNNEKLSLEEKSKLRVSQEAKTFAEEFLHLAKTKNYSTYVSLNQPYVTYVVSASPKWELQSHLWSFPIVGKVPYKGFFNEKLAREEELELQKQNLDTYLRGVSAFSTLGWFNDPIYSSMLRYRESDLVNTIIHETVHATLYIKNSADFNERMAVFIGNKGTDQFYLHKEGPNSPTLTRIKLENEDDRLFSNFISFELNELKRWYLSQKETPGQQNEEARQIKFQELQKKFSIDILPLMKTDQHKSFAKMSLNNAKLVLFKTYMEDLSDFENLYELSDADWKKFLKYCKQLESHAKPENGLKELVNKLQVAKKTSR